MAWASSGTGGDQAGLGGRLDDPFEVDRPRSTGSFGAIGAAVALDLISMPIALFVAGVSFLRLMNRPTAPRPQRR
jgi:hypothetical protein